MITRSEFFGKVGAESDIYALRFDAAGNELQTVWNVEIVDQGFGEFVRLSNEEFRTVKWEEIRKRGLPGAADMEASSPACVESP